VIDPSNLLTQGGLGGVILLAMSRMMSRQGKAEAKERETWELLIEEKIKGLDQRVAGLRSDLQIERNDRELLRGAMVRALEEVRDTSEKMTKYMEAMRGFVESSARRLGEVEKAASEVKWIGEQIRRVQAKKGGGNGNTSPA